MIVRQKRIYREDLQANPDVLYVFGDNFVREGLGGQAAEMRGEPNAVGVATKIRPGGKDEDYFTDDDYYKNIALIAKDFRRAREHHMAGGVVVVPYDGIGTGLSELPTRAPMTFSHLCSLGCGLGGPHEYEREEDDRGTSNPRRDDGTDQGRDDASGAQGRADGS